MQIITLYRYQRPEGGVTVSPVRPDGIDYTIKFRLIADDGMALVCGDTVTTCADVDNPADWREIEAPEEDIEE